MLAYPDGRSFPGDDVELVFCGKTYRGVLAPGGLRVVFQLADATIMDVKVSHPLVCVIR